MENYKPTGLGNWHWRCGERCKF